MTLPWDVFATPIGAFKLARIGIQAVLEDFAFDQAAQEIGATLS